MATIVTSFTAVGERVVLLPHATTTDRRPRGVVGEDGVVTHAPGAEPDPALADALATIDSLDRTGQAVHVAADSRASRTASRPFWADLVGGPDTALPDRAAPTPAGVDASTVDDTAAPVSGADLIIASLPVEHTGDHTSDLVAQVAARWLRVGGILAVLTHCDWSRGELIDPTGAMVASAQNADLLYLQHIVALHAPTRAGHVDLALGDAALDQAVRARHRAVVRGLPSPHRRVHSDVLVFANPHDHQTPRPAPADAAFQTGVIR
ncbi:hypothetical protein [Kutzneria sp. NPDC051319]|uniref:hypothetical protein n=1 Tax=Kutzneria sp. NPDC051319 TaxID=3155047 RepID=UPI003432F9DA